MIVYPDPPWRTHGRAYMSPYLVRASEVSVPAPLEVESHLGRTLGVLGYIVYEAPSPLTYAELVWMPCRVRVRTPDGRTLRGFYVQKMYVDLEASLRAGQEIWALPKQLATFDEHEGRVQIVTSDGARIALEIGARKLGGRGRSRTATLQVRGDEVIRFVGETTRARATAGFARVSESSGLESFMGFSGARRIRGAGVALTPFETTMQPPERVR